MAVKSSGDTRDRLPTGRWKCACFASSLAFLFAPIATAAPCAGFTDVDDTVVGPAFCANVAWMKSRGITLGCTSTTLYCPNLSVSRLQMAAFMNRLGTAMTPFHLPVDTAPGAIDLDIAQVACQTQDYEVIGFARRAYVDSSFGATAVADVGLAADLVMSTDNGATWTPLNATINRGFVRANQWSTLADVAFADLVAGQNVRWGTRVTRGGLAGAADLSDSRCALRVLVYNRNE